MANDQHHGAIEDTKVPFGLKLLVFVMAIILIGTITILVITLYYSGFLAFT